MRSFFSISLFCFFIWTQIGCSGDAASNDANAASPIQNVETNSNTPLPEFAIAGDALAEGGKLLDAGETVRAIEALTQAVRLDTDLAEAHFKLGIAYALIEAQDNDVTETAENPTPNPKDEKQKEEKEKRNSEKSFENAVAAYKKLLTVNPDDNVAHFNLGLAYNKLNEDENAEQSLREAVKLKPEDTEYQTELGSILIKLAKYHEAVSSLKKAFEFDPTNIKAEQLLEKAEAGRKRINFTTIKKEDNKPAKFGDSQKQSEESSNSNTKQITREPRETKPPLPLKTPSNLSNDSK